MNQIQLREEGSMFFTEEMFEPSVVLVNLILKQGSTLISAEAFIVVFKGLSSHMTHTCRCHLIKESSSPPETQPPAVELELP